MTPPAPTRNTPGGFAYNDLRNLAKRHGREPVEGGSAAGRSLRLAGGGGPMEQWCADVGFETIELLDERGPIDAEVRGSFGECRVSHRRSESLQAGPSVAVAANGAARSCFLRTYNGLADDPPYADDDVLPRRQFGQVNDRPGMRRLDEDAVSQIHADMPGIGSRSVRADQE